MVEPKKQPTLEEALNAVANMEALAGGTLERVLGLCRLALHALETQGGQHDPDAIVQTFTVIMHITSEAADCIGWEAEKVGVDAAHEAAHARAEGVAHG